MDPFKHCFQFQLAPLQLGMCAGVAVFSLADKAASPNFSTLVGGCQLKPVLKASGSVWLLNETNLR